VVIPLSSSARILRHVVHQFMHCSARKQLGHGFLRENIRRSARHFGFDAARIAASAPTGRAMGVSDHATCERGRERASVGWTRWLDLLGLGNGLIDLLSRVINSIYIQPYLLSIIMIMDLKMTN
jgi:hypothetical protein